MSHKNVAQAYASMGVESEVLSASPHRLIALLFDCADRKMRAAGLHMQAGRIARKGEEISKTLDIVNNGLLAALDMERGGDMAEQLASIYDYVATRLMQANARNDIEALEEARTLLNDIGSAWREIAPGVGQESHGQQQ